MGSWDWSLTGVKGLGGDLLHLLSLPSVCLCPSIRLNLSFIRLLVRFHPSVFVFLSVCLCPSIRLILSLIRLPVRFHPSACVFPSVCLCAYIRLSVRSNRTFLFKLSIRSSNPSIIPCTFPVLASTNRLLSARYLKLTHPPQTVHPISHGGRQVPGLGCY